ncbi:increased DNA methylation 3-like [Rosa rugosa]|uniref:increased DNA methylation 3-like n=1 Tax=Rosa rugosa TaxID=74645 RepID=UPI002B40DA7C|nr:increased DNA methylation 3-like [Rosa rugosa]
MYVDTGVSAGVSNAANLFRADLDVFGGNKLRFFVCNFHHICASLTWMHKHYFCTGTVKCIIGSEGKVHIEGVITHDGDRTCRKLINLYQMKVDQELCAAGPFTISFNLPGSVDNRLFSPGFRPDGILEVVVMKSKMSRQFLKFPFNGNKSSPVKFPQVTI